MGLNPDSEPSDGAGEKEQIPAGGTGRGVVTVRVTEGRRIGGYTVWVASAVRDLALDMVGQVAEGRAAPMDRSGVEEQARTIPAGEQARTIPAGEQARTIPAGQQARTIPAGEQARTIPTGETVASPPDPSLQPPSPHSAFATGPEAGDDGGGEFDDVASEP